MIEQQLQQRGITHQGVLKAMRAIPRDQFVPDPIREHAFEDRPLSIGHDQTISQPYIVALMTELADPKPTDKVLDVGTGSGYQAAVLAELVDKVFSIEIVTPLAEQADRRLQRLGYQNVEVRHGDGNQGWPEQAPFDIIVVAAASDHVPDALVDQLALYGKLIIPVGPPSQQELLVIEKQGDGTSTKQSVVPVAFVPMTGDEVEER